jgi:hypothetical protein
MGSVDHPSHAPGHRTTCSETTSETAPDQTETGAVRHPHAMQTIDGTSDVPVVQL